LLMIFLALLILALTQAIVASPGLSGTPALVAMSVLAFAALVGFAVNESRIAKNPIIHIPIFKNKVFTVSTFTSLLVSFGRGNITYGMIFFFQGPAGLSPLQAGINLIPLGMGIIITGFFSGVLADKLGYQALCVIGPFVCAAGTIGLAVVKYTANYWLIAFGLFVIGMGSGIFGSPNGTSGMLAVPPYERGVASGIRLCLTFVAQMVGIVITFAFILNSIPYSELIVLFIYGGGGLSQQSIDSFMLAVDIVFWITLVTFVIAGVLYLIFPVPRHVAPPAKEPAPTPAAKSAASNEGLAVDLVPVAGSVPADHRPAQAESNSAPADTGVSAAPEEAPEEVLDVVVVNGVGITAPPDDNVLVVGEGQADGARPTAADAAAAPVPVVSEGDGARPVAAPRPADHTN